MNSRRFIGANIQIEARESIVDPFRPAKLNTNVRTLNVAEFTEPRSQ